MSVNKKKCEILMVKVLSKKIKKVLQGVVNHS